jgi:FkbM family methyltransferase
VRLGSSDCGWWVSDRTVRTGGIAYCAGVGNDITFDLALIERYGFEVWAFDPTPAVVDSVRAWNAPPAWHFEPVGLWIEQASIRFYLPANPDHVSVSATNAQGTDSYLQAPVDTLSRIMARLGHSHIDLLKLDIEGAEGPVLEAMIAGGIRPAALCVEFDQPEHPWRVARRIKGLLAAGYELDTSEGWNFTFSRAA